MWLTLLIVGLVFVAYWIFGNSEGNQADNNANNLEPTKTKSEIDENIPKFSGESMEEKIEREGLTPENTSYIQENAEELLDNLDSYDSDVQDEILDNL